MGKSCKAQEKPDIEKERNEMRKPQKNYQDTCKNTTIIHTHTEIPAIFFWEKPFVKSLEKFYVREC